MSATGNSFYITGGTLRPDASCYVHRQADEDLYRALGVGEFCYILTSRQMGKSSMMVRTASRLRAAGASVAVLDLTAIGQNLSPEQWYGGLVRRLGRQLSAGGELEDDLDDFWSEQHSLGPLQRFMAALENVVLPRTTGPLVIFVDEIDAVRSLPFPTDEFFAAIRECYNRRSHDPGFARITFCLLGVATPSDLIQDPRVTPFNIGTRIELTDFSAKEATPLAAGLAGSAAGAPDSSSPNAQRMLQRVLYWTGGHPYLTQRLCRAVADDPAATGPGGVDRVCEALFLSAHARERDDNLIFVRERLLRSETDVAGLLDLYAQVRRGRRISADETNRLVAILRLSGITRLVEGYLLVRNRIYFRVFDHDWVIAHMPDAEVRRQRAAFRRGLLRASAVGGLLVTVLAVLAGVAIGQARRADRNASKLGGALTTTKLQRDRADRAAAAAGKASAKSNRDRIRADRAARIALAASAKSDLDRKRANESAHAARLQEQLARAATASERESARRALRLLSLEQAERGIRQLEEGQTIGLLDLLEARKTAEPLPVERESRDRLWASWAEASRGRLQAVFGHHSPATSVAFSPDERYLASAAADSVQIWDLQTSRRAGPPFSLPGDHSLLIGSGGVLGSSGPILVFSEDSHRLAIGSKFAVSLLSVPSGRSTVTIPEPGVDGAAFSSDGKFITTVRSHAGVLQPSAASARRWNTSTGQPEGAPIPFAVPAGRSGPSVIGGKGLALSDGGAFAANCDFDGTLTVWQVQTGRVAGHMKAPPNNIFGLTIAVSSDGSVVAATNLQEVQLWDVPSGQPLREPLNQLGVLNLQFSPDDRYLAAGGVDGTARVWDLETGRTVGPVLRHQSFVTGLAFSADSQRLATSSFDTTVRVWDAGPPSSPGEPLPVPGGPGSLVLSPNGEYLAALTNENIDVRKLSREPVSSRLLTSHGFVQQARFSQDGRLLAAAIGDGTVSLWDTASGRSILRTPLLPALSIRRRPSFSRDGAFLVVLGADRSLGIWRTSSGKPLGPMLRDQFVTAGTAGMDSGFSEPISPDGSLLVVEPKRGVLRLDDIRLDRPRGKLIDPAGGVQAYAFSPDSRTLAIASSGGFSLWDTRTVTRLGAPLASSVGAPLLFSPDGGTLLGVRTGIPGSTVLELWDWRRRRRRGSVPFQLEAGIAPLFSSDSRMMALPAIDGLLRVWNVENGSPHGAPLPLGAVGLPLAFSRDGSILLTVTLDRRARLWDTVSGQPCGPDLSLTGSSDPLSGTSTALAPDGRCLYYVGANGAMQWRIFHPPGSVAEMKALTSVIVGSRQGSGGVTEPVPWEDWRALRARLGRFMAPSGQQRQPPAKPATFARQTVYERIGPRDTAAGINLLDLTPFYNAALSDDWQLGAAVNDLASVPHGLVTLGGVPFDVRGVVQLAGGGLARRGGRFPKKLAGLVVGRLVRDLHVLHAAAFSVPVGTPVARVVLRYSDGETWETPVVYGKDVRDWWDAGNPGGGRLVWSGTNSASQASGRKIGLYLSTWRNPLPNMPVDTIDYTSSGTECAPFVVAVTVE